MKVSSETMARIELNGEEADKIRSILLVFAYEGDYFLSELYDALHPSKCSYAVHDVNDVQHYGLNIKKVEEA